MDDGKFLNHKLLNITHTILLIGGMLLLLAILGLSISGTQGFYWAVLFGLFFMMFAPRISPQYILRVNGARHIRPQQAPGLYQIVHSLAQQANLKFFPQLYVLPSQITNAFTIGNGGSAVICLTDSILERLNERELTGVLAHEISHIQHQDMRVLGVADTMTRITNLFSSFGKILLFISLPLILIGQYTVSLFTVFLLIFAPVLSGLLMLALSRTREFDADLGAVRLTRDPGGLVNALGKLEYYQMNILQRLFLPLRKMPQSALFRSHPPTQERIRRLLELTKTTRVRNDYWPTHIYS